MLYDKSYYDYDYKRPGEDYRTVKNEVTSDSELAARLRSMGFGIRKRPADAERLQAEVMEEEKGKHGQS